MKRANVRPGMIAEVTIKRKTRLVHVSYLRFAAHEQGCKSGQDTWLVYCYDDGSNHDVTARQIRRIRLIPLVNVENVSQ